MATTYDKASLVMIPSGVKESKLFSIKPTDGSGDFTFSRGADTATRVNASGLIEKETMNLVDYSNDFSNWTLASITPTSGQSGYDGSSDAWELNKTNTGGAIINPTPLSGVATFSIYAKAGTLDFLLFYINYNSGTDTQAYFDLSSGSVGTTIAAIDSNIEQVGATDWYRCDVSFNCPSTLADVRIFPAIADNNSGGTGTIFVQDAQLNQGLVAQDYLETTTTAVYGGVTDNLPRLDYSGGASCPSLLLEPQRTNLVESSEYIDTSVGWSLPSVSVTDNAVTSPEGVVNASKLTATANFSKTTKALSLSATTTYTASFWVKDISAGSSIRFVAFDQTNGATLKEENFSADISTTEWKRLDYSFTTTTAATIQVQFVRDLNSGEEIYFYGAQLEEASYPTSYIPTYGSSETRVADFGNDNDLVDTAISFGANDDFTLFYEGSFNDLSSTSNMIMGGGRQQLGASYKNYWWAQNATSMRIVGEAETLMANTSMSITDDTNVKLLVKRSGSVIDFFVNGSKLTTTQQTTNTAFTFRSLGWSYNNAVYKVSGTIKQALVFESALTDAECIALTQI